MRALISMKITGNAYTKQKFIELGVPKIGNVYDYQSDIVIKYRSQLEERVREIIENEHPYSNPEAKKEEKKEEEPVVEMKLEEEKPKEEEIKKPSMFDMKTSAKVNVIKVENKGGRKNKIKKVDFDFDFDSFNDVNFSELEHKEEEQPVKEEPKDDKELEEEENKKENKSQPYNIKITKEEVNKKFANKKAISSDDYAALEDNGSQDGVYSQRIKSMGNSQAISSSDVYGDNENDYQGESLTDKMKDFAINFTMKAAEKAKELKNKTNDMIAKVQNKLGGNK